MNDLKKFHKNLNSFIISNQWSSISANEIVEYNLRNLSYDYDFSIKYKTILRYTKFIPLLFLLSIFIFFISIASYIFKLAISLTIKKHSKIEENRTVFFIRNKLSEIRFLSLHSKELLSNDTLILIDNLHGYSSSINFNNIKLSSFIEINIFKIIGLIINELITTSKDFLFNSPKLSIRKILFQFIRIPNLIIFYSAFDRFLKVQRPRKICSFEMISRYSSAMNTLCQKNFVTSNGYPHGLEYDIFYPNNYFGDVFYCTSSKAALTLNKRYKSLTTKKFIYSPQIVSALFSKGLNFSKKPKLVYFTDARNPILDYENIKSFYNLISLVKLHPNDSRKIYSDLNPQYVDNYNDALEMKYVLMRPSTVIFEAAMSGCYCFCLQTNELELYLFHYLYPSLNGVGDMIKLVSEPSQLVSILTSPEI